MQANWQRWVPSGTEQFLHAFFKKHFNVILTPMMTAELSFGTRLSASRPALQYKDDGNDLFNGLGWPTMVHPVPPPHPNFASIILHDYF